LSTANEIPDTAFAKAMITGNSSKSAAVVAIPSFSRNTNSNEKPKFGPVKKKVSTKTVIKKSAGKPKQKPKAVMQPKNDY
jgi:hypothetical protein